MITEKDVRDVAAKFLDKDIEITVRRSHGGFSIPCGYTLTVYFEDRGSEEIFFHDDNSLRSLTSKMIEFVEEKVEI